MQLHISEQALQQLPEDGDLSNLTSLLTSDPQSESSQDDLYGAYLSTSFVPNAAQQRTEQETVQKSVQDLQSGSHTLAWPTIGGTPINEFTTEGYFSMAFPTLFPTGAADFLGQRSSQWTCYETWWEERERLSPTESSTTPPVYEAPVSTG